MCVHASVNIRVCMCMCRRTYQFMRWSKINEFMRHRNQIEFFVHFKANRRSLTCLQYDPYVHAYHVVYQLTDEYSMRNAVH